MARPLAAGWIAAVLLAASASTAAALDGDFGRHEPQPGLGDWLKSMLPAGLGPSSFNLTDAEVEMSNRLWRFVASPDAPPWMLPRPQTLRPARGPASADVGRYYAWLHQASYRSSAVRFATVSDDIAADLGTIPGAFAAICAVENVDRERIVAFTNLPDFGPDADANVSAREAENDRDIGEFVWALRYRYESYGFALDHLLIETPDPAVRDADAALAELEPEVDAAEAGAFCGTGVHRSRYHQPPSLPSRFVHGNPPPAHQPGTSVGS